MRRGGVGRWWCLSTNEGRGDEGIEGERQDVVHGPVRGTQGDRKVVLACSGEPGGGKCGAGGIDVEERLDFLRTVAACIWIPWIAEALVVPKTVMAMHSLKDQ